MNRKMLLARQGLRRCSSLQIGAHLEGVLAEVSPRLARRPAAAAERAFSSASAQAERYLEDMRRTKDVTGQKDLTRLLEQCENRSEFEKAVQVLRLSRGLMNNRQQFKKFNNNVTRALLESSKKAAAPDVLFELVRERNLLGLSFSKTWLHRAVKHMFTDAAPLFEDDAKIREAFDTAVVQVHDETGLVSSNVAKHLLRHLAVHGQSEIAMELAADLEALSDTIKGKSVVERAAPPPAEADQDAEGGEAEAPEGDSEPSQGDKAG